MKDYRGNYLLQIFRKNRGDFQMCYPSDLSKMKEHFSNWDITKILKVVFEEIVESCEKRLHAWKEN